MEISIHALRGEGDDTLDIPPLSLPYFNPRPPWGGRQAYRNKIDSVLTFQSTPSVGRATSIKYENLK